MGLPDGASSKEPTCQRRRPKRHGFDPWVGRSPWRRAWQPTPVLLPAESHGQRSLAGYSPWGQKRFPVHRTRVWASEPPWQCETPTGPAACARGPPGQGTWTQPMARPLGGVPARHPGHTLSGSEPGLLSQCRHVQLDAQGREHALIPSSSIYLLSTRNVPVLDARPFHAGILVGGRAV